MGLKLVSTLCTGVALCLPIATKGSPGTLSGWVTNYDKPERFKPLKEHLSQYEAIWYFGPSVQSLLEKPDTWWMAQSEFTKLHEKSTAAKFFSGPVLHNSAEKGFDSALGQSFIKSSDKVVPILKSLIKKHRWTALNIDFESLPAESADDFENFLKTLRKQFKKIKISVCLHAQVSGRGVYEGARFQRWNKLKEIDVDFVIMAYDYSWSTSKPGAIAPGDWVREVAQYAVKNFGAKKVIIALPLYGYHWNRNKDANSWLGTPDIVPVLQERVAGKGWQKQPEVPSFDGEMYHRGDQEFISFDNEKSFKEKRELLLKLGVHRFALWRIGAELDSFYKIKE